MDLYMHIILVYEIAKEVFYEKDSCNIFSTIYVFMFSQL